LLAMEANDNAGGLTERIVWTFFASRLNWPNNSGHLLRAI